MIDGVGGTAGQDLWPFEGRDREVAEVAERCDDPACGGVVLTGPAGVGKSRLASEVVAELERRRPCYVARLVANDALRTVPYGAMAHLLPDGVVDERGVVDAVRLFQELRQRATETGRGRMVLVVDDLPHLDDGALALASQLEAAGAASLVATARSDAVLPPAAQSLERSFGVRRIEVAPLDRPTTESVLEHALGGGVDSEVVDLLWVASEGNPLYLREVLAVAVEQGRVRRAPSGVWHLTGPLPASPRLADVIGERIRSVEGSAADTMRLLAVADRLSITDAERAGLLDDVEALEARGLVRLEGGTDPEIRLGHPLHGEVLRSQMGVLERRRLVRRAIDLVSSRPVPRRDDPLVVAGWQLDLGLDPAPEVLVQGARLARSALDHASTVRLASAALDATGALEMRRVLVEGLTFTGEPQRAEDIAAAAPGDGAADGDSDDDSDDDADDDERMRLLAARLYNLLWFLDDAATARAAIEAERHRATSPAVLEQLQLHEAYVRSFEGDAHGSLSVLEQRDEWSPAIAPQALTVLSQALLIVGRCVDALDAAGRAVKALDALDQPASPYDPGLVHLALGRALTQAGRFAEASEVLGDAHAEAARRGAGFTRSALGVALGEVALLVGRPVQARRCFGEAVVAAESVRNDRLRVIALGSLAATTGQLGDVTASAALLAELELLPDDLSVGADEAAKGRAWAMSALGRPVEGRDLLRRAAGDSHRRGEDLDALELLVEAARLGAASAVRHEVAALGRVVDGPVAAALVAYVEAMASPSVEGLTEADTALSSLGCELLAAEIASALSSAHKRAGDQRAASRAVARSEELAQRCEGAATPLLTVVDAVVPLSAREREVVQLAVAGLSNQEIADRLFLSVRTVGNHLQNVYTKLGVAGRAELAERMGPG